MGRDKLGEIFVEAGSIVVLMGCKGNKYHGGCVLISRDRKGLMPRAILKGALF